MAAIQKPEPHGQVTSDGQAAKNKLVGEQVLSALGKPDKLYKVQVRPLWEGHYRVNVFVGTDLLSSKVVASYFLLTDQGGHITAATPDLELRK